MSVSPRDEGIFCLGFEVKGIQGAIFEGGRLRDIVGGSDLVDELCAYDADDRLEGCLGALRAADPAFLADLRFSRRAGAAFLALSGDGDGLRRLRALWTLTVRRMLPGVELVSALTQGRATGDAIQAATAELRRARNRAAPGGPAAGPLARRAPRTGRAAVEDDPLGREPVDALTSRKRGRIDRRHRQARADRLALKFAGPAHAELVWPEVFEDEGGRHAGRVFPLLAENNYVGVVHADGNGFGSLLIDLGKRLREAEAADPSVDYAGHFYALSEAIGEVTLAAARAATAQVLAPNAVDGVVPARPVLLGGDDLTLIVRGDLALDFTREFLAVFRDESAQRFDELRRSHEHPRLIDVLPEEGGLTAGAGIAFVKASQPFYLAHDLAEQLAKAAKRRAKMADAALSCLAFHRITTAMIDDYEAILERELTGGWGERPYRLTAQPYVLEAGDHGLAELEPLLNLRDWLDGERGSRGRLRTILALAAEEPERAQQLYRRWYEVATSEDEGAVAALRDTLAALGIVDFGPEQPGFRRATDDGPPATPLFDALALRAVALDRPSADGEGRDAA